MATNDAYVNTQRPPLKERRWKGLMADNEKRMRIRAFLYITICAVAMTFVQLGFISIPLASSDPAFGILLLVPVAVAAVLLGARYAGLVGLIAGGAFYLHALVMPLNYYELAYVNPVTAIIMLPLSGLMLGGLSASPCAATPRVPSASSASSQCASSSRSSTAPCSRSRRSWPRCLPWARRRMP